ncbi:MAG: hypothetical protein HC834_10335 [Rhodospirillales bacterium]|nr:hypothetical protein [Rhodospirillales bacterium]
MRSYYDPFGTRHVSVGERCVRFLIDGRRRIKMGLRPEHTTGRMGYYRALGDGRATLIVRVFASLPGEPYCDLPRDDPRHRALQLGESSGPVLGGDALQAYNDDGDAFAPKAGQASVDAKDVTFGEMEYHDPCVISGRAPGERGGTCVTHVVVGADASVRAWGASLLGCEIEPLA